MKNTLFLTIIVTLLVSVSCTVTPEKIDYTGCKPRMFFWAVGPQANEKYVDVCYTDIDVSEIIKYFDFVAINGSNKDTLQTLDHNRDGISGNGRLLTGTNTIRWGGNDCSQYARRISQQNCQGLGDVLHTGGCEWLAVQVTPKKEIAEAYVKFSPISHLRKANGQEYDNNNRSFTTGFVNCQ